jgi:DNA-directed RNA polymerase subunit RPC12/RpoP
MCCQSDSGFSRRLQFFLMCQFRQRAAHRFPGQARIRVHDFGDRQVGGERLQDERHGNARAAHTRASAQVFRVSDNPVLHAVKLWQLRNKSSHTSSHSAFDIVVSVVIKLSKKRYMLLKYLCSTCNRYFELGDEIPEMEARCPDCGGEAKKSQAKFIPVLKQEIPTVGSQVIAVGCLLSILVPIVGFIFGVFFLFKNQILHGALCMIVSLISTGLWLSVFAVW